MKCNHCNAPVRNFSLPKEMGAKRKDLGGRHGFPGLYIAFLHLPPAWKVVLRPEKLSRRFSFGGGSVCSFLPC